MRAVHLTTRSQFSDFMVRVQQAGEGFRLPLIRAAADGSLMIAVAAGGKPVAAQLLKQNKPTTIILSDDHPSATGPNRWRQLSKLLRWTRTVFLHATGGQPEHYNLVAAATITTGRVLLVEMQHQHHAAWLQRVEGCRGRVINIVPPPGDIHPRAGAPAGVVVQ